GQIDRIDRINQIDQIGQIAISLPPNRRSSKVLQVGTLKYLEKYLYS
ncbi:hypothetical protein L249_3774, partial [Ophiocordyceps polyrhachis-furcata BCC 54312]